MVDSSVPMMCLHSLLSCVGVHSRLLSLCGQQSLTSMLTVARPPLLASSCISDSPPGLTGLPAEELPPSALILVWVRGQHTLYYYLFFGGFVCVGCWHRPPSRRQFPRDAVPFSSGFRGFCGEPRVTACSCEGRVCCLFFGLSLQHWAALLRRDQQCTHSVRSSSAACTEKSSAGVPSHVLLSRFLSDSRLKLRVTRMSEF